jgi:hypothetical protein
MESKYKKADKIASLLVRSSAIYDINLVNDSGFEPVICLYNSLCNSAQI